MTDIGCGNCREDEVVSAWTCLEFLVVSEGTPIQVGYITWAPQVSLVVKNPPANAGDGRDAGSIPGLGRSPGEGNGNPLQDSCLENSMNRGAWWATVHRVAKSWTWLSQAWHAVAHSTENSRSGYQAWLPLGTQEVSSGSSFCLFILCMGEAYEEASLLA